MARINKRINAARILRASRNVLRDLCTLHTSHTLTPLTHSHHLEQQQNNSIITHLCIFATRIAPRISSSLARTRPHRWRIICWLPAPLARTRMHAASRARHIATRTLRGMRISWAISLARLCAAPFTHPLCLHCPLPAAPASALPAFYYHTCLPATCRRNLYLSRRRATFRAHTSTRIPLHPPHMVNIATTCIKRRTDGIFRQTARYQRHGELQARERRGDKSDRRTWHAPYAVAATAAALIDIASLICEHGEGWRASVIFSIVRRTYRGGAACAKRNIIWRRAV